MCEELKIDFDCLAYKSNNLWNSRSIITKQIDREMKENEHGIWVCKKCKGAFVPGEMNPGPKSIFGVTL